MLFNEMDTLTMQPWRLDELNYGQVKASPSFDVAVLPLGATEPHNLHLPYGTDTFQVEVIAARACAIANQSGGPGAPASCVARTAPRPTR